MLAGENLEGAEDPGSADIHDLLPRNRFASLRTHSAVKTAYFNELISLEIV